MPEDGVVFADGIERDALEFVAGQRLRIGPPPCAWGPCSLRYACCRLRYSLVPSPFGSLQKDT